jgi:hypothetical protein
MRTMDDYTVPIVVVLGIPLGIDDVTQLTAEACQPVNIVRQLHVLYQTTGLEYHI